jgi:hypothetical protein
VRLRIAKIERIDDEPDIRRVLAGLPHMRNFDQLEVRFVHRSLEALVAVPVAIRLLHDDAAFQQQPFENQLDVEFLVFRVAHAERNVFEIAEQRHADGILG